MMFHAKDGIQVAFAIAVAAVVYTAVSGVTKAASIAPLPSAVGTDAGNLTPVHYYRGHYYRYRRHGHYYSHRYYRHGRYYYS